MPAKARTMPSGCSKSSGTTRTPCAARDGPAGGWRLLWWATAVASVPLLASHTRCLECCQQRRQHAGHPKACERQARVAQGVVACK